MVIDLESEIQNFEIVKQERFLARRRLIKYIRENINSITRDNYYIKSWIERKMRFNWMSDLSDTRLLYILNLIKQTENSRRNNHE